MDGVEENYEEKKTEEQESEIYVCYCPSQRPVQNWDVGCVTVTSKADEMRADSSH